jgi:hypothetical protein
MQETTKRFDCVRMKRDAQEQINRETEGMTPADRVRYFREAAERYRVDSKSKNSKGDFKALFERLEVERERRAKQ